MRARPTGRRKIGSGRLSNATASTIFYTAPTAIRAFMRWGTDWPSGRDMSSLRLLGSVGEPINPEAWVWYHRYIGGERCPVVDTWWQTETGAIMITPLPGIVSTKPGSATRPRHQGGNQERQGRKPRGSRRGAARPDAPVAGDAAWYLRRSRTLRPAVLEPVDAGNLFHGRWRETRCRRLFLAARRVDDVLNVAGHRIGTMEVESALVDHPRVAEAAVVGRPHEIKGRRWRRSSR